MHFSFFRLSRCSNQRKSTMGLQGPCTSTSKKKSVNVLIVIFALKTYSSNANRQESIRARYLIFVRHCVYLHTL